MQTQMKRKNVMALGNKYSKKKIDGGCILVIEYVFKAMLISFLELLFTYIFLL